MIVFTYINFLTLENIKMYIRINIKSKNNNSLKSFLKVFNVLAKNNKLKLNKILTVFHKKKFKKVFTILKSPHIYKTAQEQFEYILFAKTFKVDTYQVLKTLIVLKKIQQRSFADTQIKITYIIIPNTKKKIFLNYLIKKKIRVIHRHVPARKVIKSIGSYLSIANLYGRSSFSTRSVYDENEYDICQSTYNHLLRNFT